MQKKLETRIEMKIFSPKLITIFVKSMLSSTRQNKYMFLSVALIAHYDNTLRIDLHPHIQILTKKLYLQFKHLSMGIAEQQYE